MTVNREIYFLTDTEANLLAGLKINERGIVSDLIGENHNHEMLYNFNDTDIYMTANQAHYNITLGMWINDDASFKDVDLTVLTVVSIADSFVTVPIPYSQSGTTALVGFVTATSIIGALNEVKDDIINGTPDSLWQPVTIGLFSAIEPKNVSYVNVNSGIFGDFMTSPLPIDDVVNVELVGFTAASLIGALNELKTTLSVPGGIDKSIQFNDGGSAFGGDANFFYDKVLIEMTIAQSGNTQLFSPSTDSDNVIRMTHFNNEVLALGIDATTGGFLTFTTVVDTEASITNAAVGGFVTVNAVRLRNDQTASTFLNGTGLYTVPTGGTGVNILDFRFKFQTNTSAPPGSKKIRYNNSDPTLTTEIYVDDETEDSQIRLPIFLLFKEGDSILVVDETDLSNAHLFRITLTTDIGPGDYVQYDVEFVDSSSGGFANNLNIVLVLGNTGKAPGDDTEIVFNKAERFATDPEFTFDYTNNNMTIDNTGTGNFITLNTQTGFIQIDEDTSFLRMDIDTIEGIALLGDDNLGDIVIFNQGTKFITIIDQLTVKPNQASPDATSVVLHNTGNDGRIDINSGTGNQIFISAASATSDSSIILSQSGSDNLALSVAGGTGFVTVNLVRLRTDQTSSNYLDGTGAYSAPSGSGTPPGGSDTHVQFNDGGVFGGDAGMIFVKATSIFTVSRAGNSIVLDPDDSGNSTLNVKHSGGNSFTIKVDPGAIDIFADSSSNINYFNNGTGFALVDGIRIRKDLATSVFLNGAGLYTTPAGGGGDFLSLTDTPSAYTNFANAVVSVNDTPDALEFTILREELFSEDFESGNAFTLVNSGTNVWVRAAGAALDGGFSLYISNSGGTNDNYSNSSSATNHAYVDIAIPADITYLTLEYIWHCVGENSGGADQYDFGRIFYTDTGTTPVSGTLPSAGFTEIGLGKHNLQSSTQNALIVFTAAQLTAVKALGTMRLVLTWRNDGTQGSNPAFNIDNIVMTGSRDIAGVGPNIIADLQVRRLSNASVSPNTDITLTWTDLISDSFGNLSGGGQIVNILETGYYTIECTTEFTISSSGQYETRIFIEGGDSRTKEQTIWPPSAATFSNQVVLEGKLIKGQSFKIIIRQTSGSNGTILAGSSTELTMTGRRL